MKDYLRLTRTATYGFWTALPLLLLYEVLIQLANEGHARQVRVGADIWLKQLLALLGGTGHLFVGLIVVIVGVLILLSERKKKLKLRPEYLLLVIAESLIYAVVAAVLLAALTRQIFPHAMWRLQAGGGLPHGLLFNLALSLGAGLYEELVFRVLLVGAMFVVFEQLIGKKMPAYVLAALVGAALFSWVHHLGELGDPFTPKVFFYRFAFGLALQGLYYWRGFGVAAWTHALYDILVVMATATQES